MELRHFCRSSRRIAEISVPAWPMPIHQTKVTIAKPHATGTWMPHMPTPTAKRYVMAKKSSRTNKEEKANPTYHRRGVGRVSTIALILSVIDAYVWPGSMTGAISSPANVFFRSFRSEERRVGKEG